MELVVFIIGAAAGALISWLVWRTRAASFSQRAEAGHAPQLAALEERLAGRDDQIAQQQQRLREAAEAAAELRRQLGEATELRARLETQLAQERQASSRQLELLGKAERQLSDAFAGLSAQALKHNNDTFLQLAQATLAKFQQSAQGDLSARQKAIAELVAPVRESLGKMDGQLKQLNESRIADHSSLTQQLKDLASAEAQLKGETARLVQALHAPTVRGRWGEIQLKRVVEIAGMLPFCDFDEQVCVNGGEGLLKPDMIVRLPGGKNIVVDAKAPLEAYLNAFEAKDEALRATQMQHHARQISSHIAQLSAKSYWDQFQPTPEFVVMFLPGEHFFGAALEVNPHLIEEGVKQRVIIASPTTLIALLRAIHYGWQQEKIAESAAEISHMAQELYERLATFTGHLGQVGKHLNSSIEHYNRAVSSFESRVLVTARKFPSLGVSSKKELPDLAQSEKAARQLEAPEV